jgi:hypothetical protein
VKKKGGKHTYRKNAAELLFVDLARVVLVDGLEGADHKRLFACGEMIRWGGEAKGHGVEEQQNLSW